MAEFDIDHMHQLIDAAINVQSGVQASPEVGVNAAHSSLHLPLGTSQLLGEVLESLRPILTQEDISSVMGVIRKNLSTNQQEENLTDVHTVLKHCKRCKDVQSSPRLPVGNVATPDILFVHEKAILSNSDEAREFNKLILDSGIDPSSALHTSIVRCELTSQEQYDSCAKNCLGYLYSEIQILKPKLIILVGSVPAKIVLGSQKKITEDHGSVFWLGPWAIMTVFSIGYASYSEEKKSQLIADLRSAHTFCYG